MTPLILPPGVDAAPLERFPPLQGHGVVVNETDLPDEAVISYFEENSSLLGLSPSNTYQPYALVGSLMTRPKWHPPHNIVEEIAMARELAERDDDVAATIGMMIALAFGDGLQNFHKDEVTVALFNELLHHSHLIGKFKEMYREWLIAHQVTTAVVFQPQQVQFTPLNADRQRTRTVQVPHIAVLPSEQIRVLGNDIFGTAPLAYRPFSGKQEVWLQEFFGKGTTAARKAEMKREDPILTTLLTEQIVWDTSQEASWVYGDLRDPAIGNYVYLLDPRYVHRTTGPKGQWPHPRPMLTRNMPLIEAKRLLTILDHSFLEAGANFLIVAKKGSDARPALPEEIANLRDTMVRASRSGVLIGDHRINVEIITPDLKEMLNPEKRGMVGRKIAAALLRTPDLGSAEAGDAAGGIQTITEILSRVVESDRDDLRHHVEHAVYRPMAAKNDNVNGWAEIWFPKIVLQGLQFFQDMILGLRDRGDIPREYAVRAAGFNWDAAVEQRKREVASGDDKVMVPAAVPFSSPNAGPQDRSPGRPTGTKNGENKQTAPGTGKRVVQKNAGETIKAMWDGDEDPIYHVGEVTFAVLEQYGGGEVGRVSKFERTVLERIAEGETSVISEGIVSAIGVNQEHDLENIRAVRLTEEVSLLVGFRPVDNAAVTRAVVTRGNGDPKVVALRFGLLAVD